jgi:hypothetical protein
MLRAKRAKKTRGREGQTRLRAESAISNSEQRGPNQTQGREGQTKRRAERAKQN